VSISIKLGVSSLAANTPNATAIAQRLANNVGDAFANASNHDIVLQSFVSNANAGGDYAGAVSSGQLHTALEAVTGYQRREKKVDHIALLIADSYKPAQDYFGFMFDGDFEPDSSDWGAATPREGCAIFLDAIAAKRSGADFDAEVVYTAIHELGHVFNLQHTDPPSYMAQSADEAQPFTHAAFSRDESTLLAKCSSSCYIWPGGSKFGDLGDLASAPPDPSSANAPADLRLILGVDRDAFWPFEPVELDVELRFRARSTRKSISVPDAVDPGYEWFIIWIEEPDGETRRYRSPRHYCIPRGRISLSHDRPLRRDISIFGESGRFTFRKVGRHRISASFVSARGRTANSNVVEIDILPPRSGDALYIDAHALFTDGDIGKLMYHRQLTARRRRKIRRLLDFATQYPRHPSSALARYAVGRALASYTHKAAPSGAPSAHLRRAAVENLAAAVEHKRLGEHRRLRAEQELAALSQGGGEAGRVAR
jgi:hypothetical protein